MVFEINFIFYNTSVSDFKIIVALSDLFAEIFFIDIQTTQLFLYDFLEIIEIDNIDELGTPLFVLLYFFELVDTCYFLL